ncbi:MAG: single-stranded-DNA-specific exonuclease RecJ [Bacteroidales bacterium]|nr:single-stranded-DNA-specific exonuclease RecJ [Bacteroidales bacterium]
MTHKWNLRTLTPEENELASKLSAFYQLHPVIGRLLVQRGLTTKEALNDFFHPKLSNLHDPFLMPDMDKAVKRLNKALGNKEKILIYGDYDVDGTTAVALVYKFLRGVTSLLDYYIPDRYDEGYGISYKGIDYAAENGITLVISLDCGIKAIDKIEYANQKGIDFIICDHHMPDDTLPDAVAVLDAKREDSVYPYPHLSGCGVGFKFMQAFAQDNKMPFSELERLLDLTAVSIASDIVPITGENRILAHYGLKKLNDNPNFGLKGIIDVCGLNGKEITVSDIVFKIGPRINASGRMMRGIEAVDLLLSKDIAEAKEKSENVNQHNEDRRELDKKITDEANAIIDAISDISDKKIIVVFNREWHKGVIGIVASRLTEKYHRPAIVLTLSNGLVTGSARSVVEFDIYKAIEACKDLLENFGGHTYAAGLSLKEENFETFKERIESFAAENIVEEQLVPQIDIDAEISLGDINRKFFDDLKKLYPFGPDNHKPIFATRDVRDYGTSRLVGKESEHIKLEVIDTKGSPSIQQGIAFGMKDHFSSIKSMKPFSLCYYVEENTFNGTTNLQLMVKDIKSS